MGMFKDNAFFSLAVEGTYSFGVCLDGFSGAPTLYCDSNNHWSSTTTGSLCTGEFFFFFLFLVFFSFFLLLFSLFNLLFFH